MPDHPADGLPGPLATTAMLLDCTQTTRIGTLVLNNEFRHPAVLAREAASLSELGEGRFELGIGAGHVAAEFDRLGMPFAPPEVRIARLDEAASILSGLLSGQRVRHRGEHYTVEGEAIVPAPAHATPILIGGNSRRLLDVAAARADIVGLTGFSERRGGAAQQDLSRFATDAAEAQVRRIASIAAASARAPRIQVLVQWAEITRRRRRVAETVAKAFGITTETALDSPYVLIGTPREIVAQIAEHRDRLGAFRWTLFQSAPGGYPPPLRPFSPIAEAMTAG